MDWAAFQAYLENSLTGNLVVNEEVIAMFASRN
jgi:hypothetical protein